MLVTGKHFGPFWFIPMITIFYLIAMPLRYLNQQNYFYSLIFPLLLFMSFFLFRFGHNSSVFESFIYFFPIYIYGMWTSQFQDKILKYHRLILAFSCVLYVTITYLEVRGIISLSKSFAFGYQSEIEPLLNFGKIKAVALCMILLIILYRLRNIDAKLWRTLGSYSFGIYFIHLYIMRAIEMIISGIAIEITFNGLSYVFYTGIIIFICTTSVFLVRLIFGKHSRYIIGC